MTNEIKFEASHKTAIEAIVNAGKACEDDYFGAFAREYAPDWGDVAVTVGAVGGGYLSWKALTKWPATWLKTPGFAKACAKEMDRIAKLPTPAERKTAVDEFIKKWEKRTKGTKQEVQAITDDLERTVVQKQVRAVDIDPERLDASRKITEVEDEIKRSIRTRDPKDPLRVSYELQDKLDLPYRKAYAGALKSHIVNELSLPDTSSGYKAIEKTLAELESGRISIEECHRLLGVELQNFRADPLGYGVPSGAQQKLKDFKLTNADKAIKDADVVDPLTKQTRKLGEMENEYIAARNKYETALSVEVSKDSRARDANKVLDRKNTDVLKQVADLREEYIKTALKDLWNKGATTDDIISECKKFGIPPAEARGIAADIMGSKDRIAAIDNLKYKHIRLYDQKGSGGFLVGQNLWRTGPWAKGWAGVKNVTSTLLRGGAQALAALSPAAVIYMLRSGEPIDPNDPVLMTPPQSYYKNHFDGGLYTEEDAALFTPGKTNAFLDFIDFLHSNEQITDEDRIMLMGQITNPGITKPEHQIALRTALQTGMDAMAKLKEEYDRGENAPTIIEVTVPGQDQENKTPPATHPSGYTDAPEKVQPFKVVLNNTGNNTLRFAGHQLDDDKNEEHFNQSNKGRNV